MPLKERVKEKNKTLILIGTNHNFSPLEIREKCIFPINGLDLYLNQLKSIHYIKEAMIVSTCNRVEIIVVATNDVIDDIIEFLSEYSSIEKKKLREFLYIKKDIDAIRHIFMVASSLDSMVIGEPQILGQIKEAYRWSVDFMASGVVLNRIMRKAFHVAKLIKSRTDIGKGAVSIAYAALIKAKNFTDIKSKHVMVIGVGEMSRLAIEHFMSNGARIIYIANRNKEHACSLANKCGASIISLNDIPIYVNNIDIILTATSSEKPILTKNMLDINKTFLIIDIAIPRDTDETIKEMNNVQLIYLDDLKSIIDNTSLMRKKQVEMAEHIINAEVEDYKRYVESMDYDIVIANIREMAERTRLLEVNKFKRKHRDIDEQVFKDIDKMTHALVNKLLHEPTTNIRLFLDNPEGDMYIELLKKIFRLEKKEKEIKCFFSENA